ncbi:MAG: Uma2 family endonuclease [Defluviitaleaceae bacterium]|nr:Uma2 family endonuclease [Defluviitaleaceae bacterium]MCL2274404.1 Uma2 family endonuclease [Defluviitaleaceae bacterium]
MSAALKLEKNRQYTYADYLTWDDNIRREIIDGVVYNMAAPTLTHQSIVLAIGGQFRNFLQGKKCKPYISPVDVRLTPDKIFEKDKNVFQPDVVVLCDASKIDEKDRGINGAPDLVIEVLSPSTAKKDRLLKFLKYKETGVREYWLVDLVEQLVDSFNFENNPHTHDIYSFANPIPVRIIEGCAIDLSEFYDDSNKNSDDEDN